MTRVLLAGGGTAGHVNPLLAVAQELLRQGHCSATDILVVGTKEGLETRLVPEAGLRLVTIDRLPFPRRLTVQAALFWPRFVFAVLASMRIIRAHRPDVVAGFGGYVSAPVYVAAALMRSPLVIHEANAVPGFANRWGAKLTKHVVTTFSLTKLPGASLLGMPMSRAITHPERRPTPSPSRTHFGLAARKKTLVVTGGSQGSVTINSTIDSVVDDVLRAGWQVLHIVGTRNPLPRQERAGYVVLHYCDRMDLAFAAATAVISRAGAATVSEIQLLGLPAIFVPYPVGNGEQEKNAWDSLHAGAAVLVSDSDFTPDYVRATVLPLLGDDAALERMRARAQGLGKAGAAEAFVALMVRAAHSGDRGDRW
jgi:UDP-N-acetylglucosamine--N-acetylmuramyl-(pentapeptide) pyrophosphoryl-undecaprenol N-acetylglucosamine transferase